MKIKLFFILFALIFCSCIKTENSTAVKTSQNTEYLTVSAAVSLKNAFDEIGKAFSAKTGKKMYFNYGASGILQQQIESGAPVDVFASAGERQMNELEKRDLIIYETRKDFAGNSLVLIVPKDSKLNIVNFNDLTKPEVQKIAVGNPLTVPAGQYAEESLTKMNLKDVLQSKLILAVNVQQVLSYVERDIADAGIVYATDALTARENVKIVAIADEKSHSPILYPIAVIKDSKNAQTAKDFVDFVLSAEGRQILQKYGFKGTAEK